MLALLSLPQRLTYSSVCAALSSPDMNSHVINLLLISYLFDLLLYINDLDQTLILPVVFS